MTVARIYNEFFIITEDGINLFSRSSSGEQQDGMDMISGFLSALNTFAKTERGEIMKELTMEQTTFVFEKRERLIYVMTSGEPKARQLLKLFLEKIIGAFGSMFDADFANFMGDVAPFEKFGDVLAKIQFDCAVDTTNAAFDGFAENEMLQSISVISKDTGEIIFTEAKQYVNKEDLGFLVPLVTRSSEVVINQIVDQRVAWILEISSKDRVMLIQPRDHAIFVEEYKLPFDLSRESTIKPKKIKESFSRPMFLSEIKYVKIISNTGKVLDEIIRDAGYVTNIKEDATMLINASVNLVNKYYKSGLKGVAIADSNKATLFVPIKDFFVMIRGIQDDFKKFTNILKYIQQIVA
jgi:hypothetical protein